MISGVSAHWTDEEIAEATSAVYVRRIKHRVDGVLEPTSTVILGYVDNPPDYITMAYRVYRTRQYVEEPRQCHNCLRYGHLKTACRSKARCPRCAGAHTYEECTKKDDPEQVRCANCGEAHSAKYRGCTKYTEVKQVLLKATTQKVSYAQALTSVRKEKLQQTISVRKPDECNMPVNKPKKVMADACTQTETAETSTQTDEPTVIQAKQLQKTADAVLKQSVSIMDESLRRLKQNITTEVFNNYPTVETYYMGLAGVLKAVGDIAREILNTIDIATPNTAEAHKAKQLLGARIGSIDIFYNDNVNRANHIIAEKQKMIQKSETGQPVAK